MTESSSQGLLATWAPAECPFTIAYSLRTLDDIRLAVVDAFFSLPRGGAEIGGVLLGKRDPQQVTVLDYLPLDCEHAYGPSFTLSPRDLAHLSVLVEEARKNSADRQPVGWYHSHTRSDIFLSEADLEVHKRYFSSPWQIALVLKPHTFHPARGGFFFRAADGSFRIDATFQEFVLEPQPMRPVPSGAVPAPLDSPRTTHLDPATRAQAIDLAVSAVEEHADASQQALEFQFESPAAELEAAPAPPPDRRSDTPADADVPQFLKVVSRSGWRFAAVLVALACLAVCAFGFVTRRVWLPRLWPGPSAEQNSVATSLGLALTDRDGQLIVGWDSTLAAIRSAQRGTLEISSGGSLPNAVRLEPSQLRSGSFTYRRETEKVDVVLTVEGSNGELGHQSASFMGKLPPSGNRLADPAAALQRDALAVELERVKGELKAQMAQNQQLQQYKDQRGEMVTELGRLRGESDAQAARTRDLEKALKLKEDQIAKLRGDLSIQVSHNHVLAQSLRDAQSQLRLQQRKRLSKQNADTSKR